MGVAWIAVETWLARRSFGLIPPRAIRGAIQRAGWRVGRLLGLKPPSRNLLGTAALAPVQASLEIRWQQGLEGKPLKEQIRILDERIENTRNFLLGKVSDEAARRAKADEEEVRERLAELNEVRTRLQEVTMGGFRVRWYGAALILAGIALAEWG